MCVGGVAMLSECLQEMSDGAGCLKACPDGGLTSLWKTATS